MTRVFALLSLFSLFAFNAAGAVHVWTGANSDRFSDAANWRGGSPAGDALAELSFPTTSLHLDVRNDLSGLTVRVIDFSGPGYRIAGNALTLLSGAQILDSANAGNEIACDLQLAGGVTFYVADNPRPGTGASVSGEIRGIGPLLKDGPGTLTFSGPRANTYGDETRVADGTLRLQKDPGVNAVPGDVAIGPGGAERYPTLVTLADEQIPDDATIRLSSQATLTAVGIETIGPMSLDGSTNVGTALGIAASRGILVLAGDITLLPGATTRFSGGFALPATRTITCDRCNSADFGLLGEVAPGAGLVLRGTQPSGGSINVDGSYRGTTLIEGIRAEISNPNTAVRLRGGTLSGKFASAVSEWGTLKRKISTRGDLRLSSSTTVELPIQRSDSELIVVGGSLELGNAVLNVTATDWPPRGSQLVLVRTNGHDPIRGRFSQAPQGSMVGNRFRIFYDGGDGNDIAFHDETPLYSTLHLKSTPQIATQGDSVTLTAQIESDTPVASGLVTFREGTTLIATVALTASGVASTVVQPTLGVHTYTVTYSGTPTLMGSIGLVGVSVRAPAPTLLSIEPSSTEATTQVDLVLRGTGFLPDGRIRLGTSSYTPTSVTSSEAHLSQSFVAWTDDRTIDISYTQPGPGPVTSNSLPFLIKGRPELDSRLTFEPNAVLGPVAPGGGAAWLILFEGGPRGNTIYHFPSLTADTDRDGFVRQELPATPLGGVWVMTDLTDGTIHASHLGRKTPFPVPFQNAMILRDTNGRHTHVIYRALSSLTDFLWVRPGLGAWHLTGTEGGLRDLDGYPNGYWIFNTSQMQPVDESPAPPAAIEPGDVFLGTELDSLWFGARVDDHLREGDGPGQLRFVGGSLTVDETARIAHVKVMRFGGSGGVISARYTTVDDTATAGIHYAATAGTITFGPGEIFGTIDVPLLDDDLFTGTTRFRLALSSAANTTIVEPAASEVWIVDSDPPPQVTLSDGVKVSEGDDGIREFRFVASVNGAFRLPVTMTWSVTEPFRNPASGTFTFVPGGITSQTITVQYEANRTPEPDRVITIELSNVKNALPAALGRTLTIVDDDSADIVILDAAVAESGKNVVLKINTTPLSTRPVALKYTTVNGTATAGSDFTAKADTLNGADATIVIDILQDTLTEGEETFTVEFSDPTGARLLRDRATITIIDDDSDVLPSIRVLSPVIGFENSDILFPIRLSYASKTDVRFRMTTVAGTATADKDFPSRSETVTIFPGQTERIVVIRTLDDTLVEPNETFSLVLSEPVGATIASPSATATIIDSDNPAPDPNAITVIADSVQVVEGTSPSPSIARFTVRLSRDPTAPFTVIYTTADGTAFANADYTAASGTLTFAPGETSKTIDVQIRADNEPELTENLTLVFERGAVASCAIVDDDADPAKERSIRH